MKPSEYAERATLGAVLHDPQRLNEIAEALIPSDFHRPYYRAVFAAMLRLRERGAKVTAQNVKDELPNRPEVAAHLARNAVPLIDLMEATPRAGAARSYAAMVAEASLHRRVDTLGEHLTHAASNGTAADMAAEARSGQETLTYTAGQHPALKQNRAAGPDSAPGGGEDQREQLAQTRAQLETMRDETRATARAGDRQAGRLAALTDAVLGILDTAATWSIDARKPLLRGEREFVDPDRHHPGAPAPRASTRRAETRQQKPGPEPDPGRAELEDRLLASLATEPAQLDKMGGLDPSMFTAPGRRGLLEALTRTHRQEAGVDELTVLWEAQRAGVLDEIAAEDAHAALSDGLPGVAATTAAELGQAAAKDDTRQSAHELRETAADPTRAPGHLLTETQRSLEELANRCDRHERAGEDRHHQLDLNHHAEQDQGERDEAEANQAETGQKQAQRRERRSEVPDQPRAAELQQVWEQRWPDPTYRAPERDTTKDAEGKASTRSDERTHSARIADRFVAERNPEQAQQQRQDDACERNRAEREQRASVVSLDRERAHRQAVRQGERDDPELEL